MFLNSSVVLQARELSAVDLIGYIARALQAQQNVTQTSFSNQSQLTSTQTINSDINKQVNLQQVAVNQNIVQHQTQLATTCKPLDLSSPLSQTTLLKTGHSNLTQSQSQIPTTTTTTTDDLTTPTSTTQIKHLRNKRKTQNSTKDNQKRVSNTKQTNKRTKLHKCIECNRVFARSDMLTRHFRLHSGLKPYQCSKCLQVFSRSDHLATHERTHTGEKPYQCNLCAYSACRRDMITRHMRTHSHRKSF